MVSLWNSAAMFVPLVTKHPRTIFMAINTEKLRTQLHQLHSEAEKTRAKASNARLRLMRLSEAAQKLQQQAASDVRIGKENEARELLVQKRKVMQALEKSKGRIEMLDELLAKLNEAISVKETQLIGNVSLGFEVGENASSSIRFISPKEENSDLLYEDQDFEPVTVKHAEDHELQLLQECEAKPPVDLKDDIEEGSLSMEIWNEAEFVNSLKGISSYEEFLQHLDKQLNKIEIEVVTVLRLSTLVLESGDKPKNSKVQQTQEILENVRGIRRRISSITKMKAGIN